MLGTVLLEGIRLQMNSRRNLEDSANIFSYVYNFYILLKFAESRSHCLISYYFRCPLTVICNLVTSVLTTLIFAGKKSPFTWEQVLKVLYQPAVGGDRVADELKEKYRVP